VLCARLEHDQCHEFVRMVFNLHADHRESVRIWWLKSEQVVFLYVTQH